MINKKAPVVCCISPSSSSVLLLLLLLLLALAAAPAAADNATADVAWASRRVASRRRLATTAVTVAPGFSASLLFAGLALPQALSFHPADGRVIISGKAGVVLIGGGPASMPLSVLLALPPASVKTIGDGGFLNAVLDPFDAAGNYRFLYVQYLVPGRNGGGNHQRVSRFALNAGRSAADPQAEEVLFEHTVLAAGTAIHFGGGLAFGLDGFLYSTHGSHVATDSQLLSTTNGKIVRFARDGAVPRSNPFFDASLPKGSPQLAIWALGLRNPFVLRGSHVAPGTAPLPDGSSPGLTEGDVGEATWEEINVPVAGANLGWPTIEGKANGAKMAPSAPGVYLDPVFAYRHQATLGKGLGGGCCITGATRYDATAATITRGAAFPPALQGNTFFSDLCGGWIGSGAFGGGGGSAAPAVIASGLNKPIALALSPVDGALYVIADAETTQASIWVIKALLAPGGGGVGPASAAIPPATTPGGGGGSSSSGSVPPPPPPPPPPAVQSTSITAQPAASFTGYLGAQTTLFVGVASTTTVTYLWQKAAPGAPAAFSNIAGANASSFAVAPLTLAMQGRLYRCLVTPLGGAVLTSAVAAIRVATFKAPTLSVTLSINGVPVAGGYSTASATAKTLPCPYVAGSSFPPGCASVAAPAVSYSGGDAFVLTASGTDFSASAAGVPIAPTALSWVVSLFHDDHTHQMLSVAGASAAFTPPPVGEYDPAQSFGFSLTAVSGAGGAASTLFFRAWPALGAITLAPTAAAAAAPLAATMSVLVNGAPTLLPTTFATVAGMSVALAASPAGSPACVMWSDGLGDRNVLVPKAALNKTFFFNVCSGAALPAPAAVKPSPQPLVSGSAAVAEDEVAAASATAAAAAPDPPLQARASGASPAQAAIAALLTLLAGAAALGVV